MEAVFFVATPAEARGVASSDDLPGDVAAEPMPVDGPGGLLGLGAALGLPNGPVLRQLRDATCQSFPVWALAGAVCARLLTLEDHEVDDVAKAWEPHPDADLYERATCLTELRDSLRRSDTGEKLFALLEERAF